MSCWVLVAEVNWWLRNAEAAIKVETGVKGVKIMNLMVSGGTEAKNIGIHFAVRVMMECFLILLV